MEDYKLIPLRGKYGRGKFAKVSPEDYDELSKFKWYVNNRGYAARMSRLNGKRKTVLMHRSVLNAEIGTEIDHANQEPLDNRRCNLRFATREENQRNKYKPKGKSKYKGVHPRSTDPYRKWMASIRFDGETHTLGHFFTEEEAAIAYDKAALEHHGEFAAINGVTEADIPDYDIPEGFLPESGFKGVSSYKEGDLYQARIGRNRKLEIIGYYKTAEEAARAYDLKAKEYFGDKAYLNFPKENFDTPQQARVLKSNNSTGYRGVEKKNGKFYARIGHNWKLQHIGTFDSAEEAARAYDAKAKELKGDKAILNFP